MTEHFLRHLTVRDVYDSLLSPTSPSVFLEPLRPVGQLLKTKEFVNDLLFRSTLWFSGFKDRLPPLEELLRNIFTTTRNDHDFSRTRKVVVLQYIGYAMHRSFRLFDNELNHTFEPISTRQTLEELINACIKPLNGTSAPVDAPNPQVHDSTQWILDRAIQSGEHFSKKQSNDKKLAKYLGALKSTLSKSNFDSIKPNEWTDLLAICISPLVMFAPSIPHSYVRSNHVVHKVPRCTPSLTFPPLTVRPLPGLLPP